MHSALYIYIGGVIALLCESLLQWQHPYESQTNETFLEAVSAAAFWPLMAISAIVEFLVSQKR